MKTVTISSKIIYFFSLLGLVLIVLTGDLWLLFVEERSLTDMHIRRYESRQLAEELRNSSDELTRMARTYVVSGDPRFLEYYNQIVAIRDGKAPRPQNYENIYWDFVVGDKKYQTTPGRALSIIDKMKELHFTESEIQLLSEAKRRSDTLITMENQAFNALIGKDVKTNGENVVDGKPDPELARSILFSDAYHIEKAKIMLKINNFFNLINDRTRQEVQDAASHKIGHLIVALFLSTTLFALCLFGFLHFHKIIIRPLKNLSGWISAMQNGVYIFDSSQYTHDEIGIVANTFSVMAKQVSSSISNLEYLSSTDPLTNLGNRLTLNKSLLNELYRFERYKTPCSIIMLDIDHFKRINDKFGHTVGDKILIEISGILTTMMRKTDVLGRWGGEEFLIIVPNVTLINARQFAEFIRKNIADHKFDIVGKVTVSLGVAELENDTCLEDVIKNVDQLLYKAKREGRNRVC